MAVTFTLSIEITFALQLVACIIRVTLAHHIPTPSQSRLGVFFFAETPVFAEFLRFCAG
jgi:hypothetical protein